MVDELKWDAYVAASKNQECYFHAGLLALRNPGAESEMWGRLRNGEHMYCMKMLDEAFDGGCN